MLERAFVEYDDLNQRVNVEPEWSSLLPDETELVEPRSTVANFIIPGKTSIEVWGSIHANQQLNKIDVKVTVRINNRIREVAINF